MKLQWHLHSDYKMTLFIFVLLTAFTAMASGQDQSQYLEYQPKRGESLFEIFDKFQIAQLDDAWDQFCNLNNCAREDPIYTHKSYLLPIQVIPYNGTSIRSTLGIPDWNFAKKLQDYNRSLLEKGLRSSDYMEDQKLWVPLPLLKDKKKKELLTGSKSFRVPLFGKEHENFDLLSNRLEGKVFYLVSGHGGPDPGAIANTSVSPLCEDEYAYDVVLRLGKNLMQHGADVRIIIQDQEDGIRSEKYLECNKNEICISGSTIPLNQLKRLQQRAQAINDLFIENHQQGVKEQFAIMIHVDSRSVRKRQDVFFYHLNNSQGGKQLAKTMHTTFQSKYKQYRASGQYKGSIAERDLYMLRSTYPPAVFIELGNLKNPHDQKRILLESNRQALANWLSEALMNL